MRCGSALLFASLCIAAARADARLQPPPAEPRAEATAVRLLLDPALIELAGLESALRSHLATLDATLGVELEAAPTALDRAWVEQHREHARRDGVRAVFWLRRSDPSGVQLYLLDPATGHAYVRRVDVPVDAGPTALEVLGLIVKSTTAELIDGAPLGMERVVIAAPMVELPRPLSPRPAPRRMVGELRIAAGYVGTSYAKTARWRSGGGLWVGWAFPFGLELALGYTPMQWTRAARGVNEIVVRRQPFELAIGYAGHIGRVVLAGDVAFVIDRSVRVASTSDPALVAEPKRGSWLFAIAPRLRVEVRVVRWFGLFAALGVEFWLNRVEYGVSAPEPAVLVSPWRIRPWFTLGPVFRVPILARARRGVVAPHLDRRARARPREHSRAKRPVRSPPSAAL